MDITGNNNNNHGPPEKHVAVYTFPFTSHPYVLLRLVRRLASAAPTVVFSFFNTKKSNQKLFSEVNYDNIRPYDVSDGIPKDYVFLGKPQEDVNLFLQAAEDEFRKGLKAAEDDVGLKISCLIVDAFFWFSADIADEMNIPWVASWVGGACSLSSHFYTDLIREKHAQLKGPDVEILDLIAGLSAVRLGDLPGGVICGNLESPFSIMLHKMGKTLARATAVSLNSFQELYPDITKDLSSKFKKLLNIGPSSLVSKQISPLISDEFSCIHWLDNQKPRSVVYICFGSLFMPPPHELVALAEALEETKTPFLWSTNNESTKHFPKGFLERASVVGIGKVVPCAPQVQVLDHFATRVSITHGGWNSVLESIGAGVPIICRPILGDNQINTCMVERVWRIGMKIEGGSFTKNGTCYALEQGLSVDGPWKMWKERIEVLKDVAHKAVGPNGSSAKDFKTLVDVVTG